MSGILDAIDDMVRDFYRLFGLEDVFFPSPPASPMCGDMLAATGDLCALEPGHVGVHEHDGLRWFGNVRFEVTA